MNKLTPVILLLCAASFYVPANAQNMNSTQTGVGAVQSTNMQNQMMTHEMARDMSKMMQQMTLMTRDMDRLMKMNMTMDQVRTQEMAHVMDQLSQAMHNMSQRMADGNMDHKTMREMEQHMNKIRDMIKAMEQKQ